MIASLQVVVVIYTLSSVMSKLASGEEFLSFNFLLFYGLQIFILGIYAIVWQQLIKRCDLSIAYANRSMAILWSLIWAVVLFGEQITIKNVIGVIVVFIGTMIVNSHE